MNKCDVGSVYQQNLRRTSNTFVLSDNVAVVLLYILFKVEAGVETFLSGMEPG